MSKLQVLPFFIFRYALHIYCLLKSCAEDNRRVISVVILRTAQARLRHSFGDDAPKVRHSSPGSSTHKSTFCKVLLLFLFGNYLICARVVAYLSQITLDQLDIEQNRAAPEVTIVQGLFHFCLSVIIILRWLWDVTIFFVIFAINT